MIRATQAYMQTSYTIQRTMAQFWPHFHDLGFLFGISGIHFCFGLSDQIMWPLEMQHNIMTRNNHQIQHQFQDPLGEYWRNPKSACVMRLTKIEDAYTFRNLR